MPRDNTMPATPGPAAGPVGVSDGGQVEVAPVDELDVVAGAAVGGGVLAVVQDQQAPGVAGEGQRGGGGAVGVLDAVGGGAVGDGEESDRAVGTTVVDVEAAVALAGDDQVAVPLAGLVDG